MAKKKTTPASGKALLPHQAFVQALLLGSPEEKKLCLKALGISDEDECAELLTQLNALQELATQHNIDINEVADETFQMFTQVSNQHESTEDEKAENKDYGQFLACVLFKKKPNLKALKTRLKNANFDVVDWESPDYYGDPTDRDTLFVNIDDDTDSQALISTKDALTDNIAQSAVQASIFGENIQQVVSDHRYILVVAVCTTAKNLHPYVTVFLRLVCAALEDKSALGVFQNGTILEKNHFLQAAKKMMESQVLNSMLLLSILHAIEEKDGQPVVTLFTKGCSTFGLSEFEVRRLTPQEADAWVSALFIIANYVMVNDKALDDDEVLDGIGTIACRANVDTDSLGRGTPVIVLSALKDA